MSEHLLPEESPFDRSFDEYLRAVEHWLLPKIERPVVATVVCLPSFDLEWAICIHGSEDLGYAATLTEPSTKIWCAGEYAIESVKKLELDLTATRAMQCHKIWRGILCDTRYPDFPSMGGDGVCYHFLCRCPTHGLLCGKTWCPDQETKPGRLASLCHALRLHLLSDGQPATDRAFQSEIDWFDNAPSRPVVRDGAADILRKSIARTLDAYERGLLVDTELVALISSNFDDVRYPNVAELLDIIDLLPESVRQRIRKQNRS